jgi:hypothetical protein
MLNETYNIDEKKKIASEIKNIDLKTIKNEFIELQKIGENASNMSERCRIGNNIVDYYTFVQRLHTRGKYNVNYFEFEC